ncbi:hypothetical protein FHETE_3941 [Fusarium heterosporum]|uniref:Secreted LysM effector LysM C-terminal domain-containing protein n=1 Tax=Fusarium heterosporum TaxID=42747 RepID=A0A8H5TH30_FUSHE|nr:hypothetical protein FHETE_3941 [Fusarium heterosporum]
MRFSLLSILAAAIPAALGWEVTLYDQFDCNDHKGNFNYMIISGQGALPYCIGPGDMRFPPGVTCQFFGNGGIDSPTDCTRQITSFKSWFITRGAAIFWEQYDDHDAQPDNLRCNKQLFMNDASAEHGVEGRCRNAWYHADNEIWEREIKGISAWDEVHQG